jgi:polysaccharide pyruvyl transferase WcaK-like protein
MNRRRFLQTTLAAAVTAPICAAEKRPPRIVLRSSWQTVNIGDIAHTPGVLRLLEEHLPEADVRLWPGSVGDGVEEVLLDKLPEDVKAKVVWRERYWLTDEAVSTYVRSAGLFGNEMHSPIMCVGNGVPALVCRFKEQTSKGFMWRDIGLGDWLFDLDNEADVKRVAPAVLELARNPAAAKAKAARARDLVRQRQRETMTILRRELFSISS